MPKWDHPVATLPATYGPIRRNEYGQIGRFGFKRLSFPDTRRYCEHAIKKISSSAVMGPMIAVQRPHRSRWISCTAIVGRSD
eukprot:6213591-Pleurochrysis_carterae.AAC.4